MEINDKSITRTRSTEPQDMLATVLDRDWMKRSFMVSDSNIEDTLDKKNRYVSTADFKMVNTMIGRNIGINPRPQFTRYSDIRRKGRISSRHDVTVLNTSGDHGIGRYYSEAIDDPSQTVYFRFGVPEYTSLLDFLGRAFDPDTIHLAKTGRVKSMLFDIGKVIGGFVGIIAFPQVAAIMFIGKIANTMFSKPRYKFYTLKPTMHNYWSSVNLLVNSIAINLKLLPTIIADESSQLIGKPFKISQEALELMSDLLPDIISKQGYIDMFAVANQAQVAANRIFLEEFDALDSSTQYDFKGYLKDSDTIKNFYVTNGIFKVNDSTKTTLDAFINDKTMISEWFKDDGEDASKSKVDMSPNIDPNTGKFDPVAAKDKARKTTYTEYIDSEFRSGSQFAVFKVNYTSPPSESFSNSVKESEISKNINERVSQVRDLKFSMGQFKLPGAVGDVAASMAGAVSDVLSGALSGITFGVSDALTSILSGTYVDIPKHWQSSDVNLAKAQYSMTLISPYGNPVSLLQNIYMPLAMLMAGALPLAGGKASYTSPFICELYDKGKIQIRSGMIESLTITRGTSNLGYTVNNKPLAIDVSISVVDLSSIMAMPIAPAGIKEMIKSVAGAAIATISSYNPAIDEDNLLYDYLAVLTGLDIYSQIYPLPKAKLNLARSLISVKAMSSPAAWAMLTNDAITSSALQYSPIGWFQYLVDGSQPPSAINNPGTN
jgi:hypothetical protein